MMEMSSSSMSNERFVPHWESRLSIVLEELETVLEKEDAEPEEMDSLIKEAESIVLSMKAEGIEISGNRKKELRDSYMRCRALFESCMTIIAQRIMGFGTLQHAVSMYRRQEEY